MPRQTNAEVISETDSADSVEEMNAEFNVGDWDVLNLHSMESVPFSDMPHLAYDRESNFLDSMLLSNSQAFGSNARGMSRNNSAQQQQHVSKSMQSPLLRGMPMGLPPALGAAGAPANSGTVRERCSIPTAPPLEMSSKRISPSAGSPLNRVTDAQKQILDTLVRRELKKGADGVVNGSKKPSPSPAAAENGGTAVTEAVVAPIQTPEAAAHPPATMDASPLAVHIGGGRPPRPPVTPLTEGKGKENEPVPSGTSPNPHKRAATSAGVAANGEKLPGIATSASAENPKQSQPHRRRRVGDRSRSTVEMSMLPSQVPERSGGGPPATTERKEKEKGEGVHEGHAAAGGFQPLTLPCVLEDSGEPSPSTEATRRETVKTPPSLQEKANGKGGEVPPEKTAPAAAAKRSSPATVDTSPTPPAASPPRASTAVPTAAHEAPSSSSSAAAAAADGQKPTRRGGHSVPVKAFFPVKPVGKTEADSGRGTAPRPRTLKAYREDDEEGDGQLALRRVQGSGATISSLRHTPSIGKAARAAAAAAAAATTPSRSPTTKTKDALPSPPRVARQTGQPQPSASDAAPHKAQAHPAAPTSPLVTSMSQTLPLVPSPPPTQPSSQIEPRKTHSTEATKTRPSTVKEKGTASAPTAKTRERPATTSNTSEDRLVGFVNAVSDPEVLHVVYDYLREKCPGARYEPATKACEELLARKEKLLEEIVTPSSSAPTDISAPRTAAPGRRVNVALVADSPRSPCTRSSRAASPGTDRETATSPPPFDTTRAGDADNDYPSPSAEEEGSDASDSSSSYDPDADEFDDHNTRDTPYPPSTSTYNFGEPSVYGSVTKVFREGMLFKIVDGKGDYYFFNDTLRQIMMVRVRIALCGDERINERAILTPIEGTKETEITIVVLPEETNFLIGGVEHVLPRVMAKAVNTPDDFVSPSVTKAMTKVNAGINAVRAALGQWSRATDQKSYLKCCLKHGLKFTDLTFRPSATSLFRPDTDLVRIPPLTWGRPQDYLLLTEVSEARLFRGEISCHHVKQGELHDHTIIAAIAAIAQSPEHVRWMFRHPISAEVGKLERAVGAYCVTLLHNGWWSTLLLDDYVPCSMKGALFGHCPDDPRRLWVQMLEKAYAKSLGSYSAICLVDVMEAMSDFTGYPVRYLDQVWYNAQLKPTELVSVNLFKYVERCVASNYLVLLFTPAPSDEQATQTIDLSRKRSTRFIPVNGVVPQFIPGHIYFLCDAAYYKELDLRMVRLKNPWTWESSRSAAREREKKWKYSKWFDQPDSSMSLASTHRFSLGNMCRTSVADADEEERKGTMWLEWGETLAAFGGGGVCYTAWDWHCYRAQNQFVNGRPEFVLELEATSKKVEGFVTITLEAIQEVKDDEGYVVGSSYNQNLCGVTLLVSKANRVKKQEEVISRACEDIECIGGASTYVKARDVSMKLTLDPTAGPYHVVPLIEPAEADKLRESGGKALKFVLSLILSAPAIAGDVSVRFKQLPRTCAVFRDAPSFTVGAANFVKAAYQITTPRGVITEEGRGIVDDTVLEP